MLALYGGGDRVAARSAASRSCSPRSTSRAASSSRSACCACSGSEGDRTMITTIRSLAYLVASLLFILSLRGLSTQETARRGNRFGVIGMLVAVVMTALALLVAGRLRDHAHARLDAGRRAGRGAGRRLRRSARSLAARVAMTSMPELVAMLHSFVGAAAVLVGIATYLQPGDAYERRPQRAPGRDLRRRAGRRGDVQRVGHRVRQAARHHRQPAAAAARAPHAQPDRRSCCAWRWA